MSTTKRWLAVSALSLVLLTLLWPQSEPPIAEDERLLGALALSDNFESYSNGDLNGQNGGSGWTGAWSGDASYDVQGTTVYEGTKAVQDIVGANQSFEMLRGFTSDTDGHIYLAFRQTSVSAACGYFIIRQSGSTRGTIRTPCTLASGKLQMFDASPGSYVDIATGLSADTWYILDIELDAGTDLYRARVATAGVWGAYTATQDLNAGTGFDALRIIWEGESSTSGTLFLDMIQTTDPLAVAAPGTQDDTYFEVIEY